MSLDQASSTPSTGFKIGLWVLRVLSAFPFLGGAFMKLSSNPQMVEEFEKFGLGQWFRYFTAIVEGFGAILTLIPATSPFGLLVLLGVDGGAGGGGDSQSSAFWGKLLWRMSCVRVCGV